MDHTAEDYGLIDDTQEGFRRNRSTKPQLGKLHSMFAEQRQRNLGLPLSRHQECIQRGEPPSDLLCT